MTEIDFADLATQVAKDSFINNFESRRGSFTCEDDPTLMFIYDNNPWVKDPGLRDAVLYELVSSVRQHGVVCLGDGHYPLEGEDTGYTKALVFRATPDQQTIVLDNWRALLNPTTQL